ncbi:MAG: NAD-dependent epimerase/dehydratase family protein [Euzebyales bacterium]|nr:NAD-dependent epimerase/dehydratase family protein [Euzebyales bacterium]
MRVLVLGGTRFVGRGIVARLAAAGHEVRCVHRGTRSHDDLPATHLLVRDRRELPVHRDAIAAFAPDAVVDVSNSGGEDAETALEAIPDAARLVAISSCDTYRAFASLHGGRQTDALPLTETSPVREPGDGPQWGNLDVEARYLARGGTVLRLGAVYGQGDYQRRFDFVLRRVRAGRARIPVGSGTFLFSHVDVADVAEAVRLVITDRGAGVEGGEWSARVEGQVFNVAESATWPYRARAERVLAAAGSAAALVQVDDERLPADLAITGTLSQHLLVSSAKLREVVGWRDGDAEAALAKAVEWYQQHPPEPEDADFSADDAALA